MIWTILLAWLAFLVAFVAIRVVVTWNDEPDFSEYDADFAWPHKPMRALDLDASQFRRLP